MKKPANSKQTFAYFGRKAGKYKWLLVVFFIATTAATIGQEFLTTLVYKEVFDLMAENLDNREAIFPALLDFLWIFLVIHILTTFLGWRAAHFINDFFQPLVMRDIEEDCFRALQNHSYQFFTNNFTGGLVSKTNRFVRSFEMIADIVQWNLSKIIVMFIVAFGIIYYFVPIIAVLFMIWTILYVAASYFYARWSIQYWRANASMDSRVTGELADNLTNIFNVKIFAGKNFELNRFTKAINLRQRLRTAAWMTGTFMKFWQSILMIGFEIILIYLMMSAWTEGQITLGTIFAIQTFVWILFGNLWNLGQLFQDYSNALADAEEMTTILNAPPDISDPAKPQISRMKKGLIEFTNLDFKYETEAASPQVFSDFNLTIPAGQKIGLVGESGAGKSTLISLLLRFMDVNKGKICIDGQSISKVTQEDLRQAIAYVPQEPILFHRSLAENIAYGRPEATKSEIIEAAKNAHAHEFVQTFSEGYDTLVGERGVKLSGGQKQRVAIARAMLKKAPILILDEATSSLDSKTESFIQEALEKLMKNRTTIVIAHRLSTLRQMDRIVVFDQGKLVEEGTHQQLVHKKGKYAELWHHQSGGFIE